MIEIVDRSDFYIHKFIDRLTKEEAYCADEWLRHCTRYGYTCQKVKGYVDEYSHRAEHEDRYYYHLAYDVHVDGSNDADFYNKTMEARKMMDDLAKEIVVHLNEMRES